MTNTLMIRNEAPPTARWSLPEGVGTPKADAFSDALIAGICGNEQALDQHRAAALERARHGLPEGLLAGARQARRIAEVALADTLADSRATASTVEAALLARHEAQQRVEALAYRLPPALIRTPAQDRLQVGVAERAEVVRWCCLVAVENRLVSPEQLKSGVARSAAGARYLYDRAADAQALLDRGEVDPNGTRAKNARGAVAEVQGFLGQANALLGLIDEGAVL